ncbi:MAG TPA: branched-chain amino acid ABC transporter permease [Candidatus Dormibacteraeota bacterium]|jgi:branched-chain amino acid transport system permease protein|nr:branched-chain amino acid ABC transporter permease [Candidatus Dormibacteraeota bacterium]
MGAFTAFGQQIVNGVAMGSLYALLASSVAVVFGVAKIPDFSMGQRAMLGAYIVYFTTTWLHLDYWIGLILGAFILFGFGLLTGRLVFWPLRGQAVNGFIGALGVGVAMEAAALLLWSFTYRSIPTPSYFRSVIALPGHVRVTGQVIIVFGVALVVSLLLAFFFQRTALGRSIRAVAGNELGARLSGVDIQRVVLIAMGLGSAVAAIAGGLGGLVLLVYPQMGDQLILVAFAAVIAGGFGDVRTALIAGFILGLAESLGSVFISSAFQTAYPFAIVIVILLLRPTGLLGRRRVVGQRLSHEL